MKRYVVLALVLLGIASTPAVASEVPIGLLSFDVFIPAGNGPGIDAFDIFNFTGPTYGPFAGAPYAADALTLDNAILTVYFLGGSSQLVLGPEDIGPGELLFGGFPPVQFPSNTQFVSAVLSGTLSQTTFTLSDGSTFTASPSISVDLTPSSGGVLVAGVDFVPIYAESAAAGTPEPCTGVLLLLGLVGVAARRRR
jgi:MYXO-CTERM domain-containing protein